MKKLSKFVKSCEKWQRALKQLFTDLAKAWRKYKATTAKITFFVVLLMVVNACNSVRATVKNGEGTTTTITVTTNNPSNTQVSPSATTDLNTK